MSGPWVYRDGELVEKSRAAPLNWGFLSRSQAVPMPMLISDTSDAFRSMADGQMYDSKSAYRASLKVHGMREIGNEIPAHMKQVNATMNKPDVKPDLIAAYKKVQGGYKPQAPIVEAIGRPDLDT